jgi:hypothetical protein
MLILVLVPVVVPQDDPGTMRMWLMLAVTMCDCEGKGDTILPASKPTICGAVARTATFAFVR